MRKLTQGGSAGDPLLCPLRSVRGLGTLARSVGLVHLQEWHPCGFCFYRTSTFIESHDVPGMQHG